MATTTTDWVKEVEKRYLKSNLPDVKPGDSVKVKIKITEGNKERIQAYEGIVIKVRGAGLNKTITVRRVFQGVGVERVFLLHSPKVEGIQILRKGDVRRAKLYFLRERTGKAARIKEKLGAALEKTKAASAAILQEAPVEVAEPIVEASTTPEAEVTTAAMPAETETTTTTPEETAPATEAASEETPVAPESEESTPPAEEA